MRLPILLTHVVLVSDQNFSDPTLMRFLVARSMDPEKAAKMFAQWQKWRVNMVPNGFISESEITEELEARKIYLQVSSRTGRPPLMVIKACKHFPSKDQLQFKSMELCFSSIIHAVAFLDFFILSNHYTVCYNTWSCSGTYNLDQYRFACGSTDSVLTAENSILQICMFMRFLSFSQVSRRWILLFSASCLSISGMVQVSKLPLSHNTVENADF